MRFHYLGREVQNYRLTHVVGFEGAGAHQSGRVVGCAFPVTRLIASTVFIPGSDPARKRRSSVVTDRKDVCIAMVN